MQTDRLFPLADSALLAAAVWCAGTSAAQFFEGGGTTYWFVLAVGLVTFASAFFFGSRRGRGNVDGVFLGPRARIGAILLLVAGIGSWALQVPREAACIDGMPNCNQQEESRADGEESEAACSADTSNLMSKIRAAGHQECGDLVVLRKAAANIYASCSDEGSMAALKAYEETIKKYPAACKEKSDSTMALAEAIVQRPGKDRSLRIIEHNPSGVEIEVPDAPPAVPGEEPPATEDEQDPSNPSVEERGRKPAEDGGGRRLSYSASMRERLLRIILAILRFQFPLLSMVSTAELLQGVLESDTGNGGKPLRLVLDKMNDNPAARNQLIAHLYRIARVTAPADPFFAAGVRAFVAANLDVRICFDLISRATEDDNFKTQDTSTKLLMDAWRDKEQSQRDRITKDVEQCIRANIDGKDARTALEEFKRNRGIAIGS